MQTTLMAVLSIHVLAAVFWAGSTFTLARAHGLGATRLFGAQLGAAVMTVVTGGYLWRVLHGGVFEITEQVLATGIASALLALVIQLVFGGATALAVRRGRLEQEPAERRAALTQRVAALFLAIAIVFIVSARYV